MALKSVRFRSSRITKNENGKLFFILMVSPAFIICGLLEKLSVSDLQYSELNQSEIETGEAKRYCDPPNMTIITVYYDSNEDAEDYDLPQDQETIFEKDVSIEDIQQHQADIFSSCGYILSFFPACFLTSRFTSDKVFLFSILLGLIFVFGFSEMDVSKPVGGSIIGFILGVVKLSFYDMAFEFVSAGRNSFIALASVQQMGGAIADILTLFSVKKNWAIYTTGIATLVWFIVFSRIQTLFSRSDVCFDKATKSVSQRTQTPWKSILCSRPVWMTTAAIFGCSCGTSCIFTGMRLYLKYVYFIKVEILTAVSSLLHIGFAILCGFVIDFLLKARIVSRTSSRRMIVYISHFIPAGILFVLGFVGCTATTPMVFYCLAIMMTGANYTGAYSSPLDLAPKYTKSILALCFTIGTSGAVLINYLISCTLEKQVYVTWRFIFSLNSLILLLTAIFFMLRGSGSIQTWNDPVNKVMKSRKVVQQEKPSDAPVTKTRTKSIYMVEKKILKVLHVQEPDRFTRVRAYSTSLPNERSKLNISNVYRPSNKKRASIS